MLTSSNQRAPNSSPVRINMVKPETEMILKDLSFIQPSNSDSDTSVHNKSCIVTSNENRSFTDDLNYSNTIHSIYDPLSQSSILENSDFEIPLDESNEQQIEKITLGNDSPTTSKIFPPKNNPPIIDLTGNAFDKKPSKSNSFDNSQKLTASDYKSLKMEKERLEEVMYQITKNIENMKVSR